MAVVDASVYVALVNAHERDYARSWTWLERAKGDREAVIAPVILMAEVAAALSHGAGDPVLAHRVVQQLQHGGVIQLVAVTLPLAERAAAIAADYQIRGCDAVYVALADQLDDCLVTLDRQQLSRCAAIVEAREP
ncbi:MAG: PIN domain-containing protein [Chloroflexi bacterium]|nr:MAG: PIN domain-containing protein [Chloroflexota bacterium]